MECKKCSAPIDREDLIEITRHLKYIPTIYWECRYCKNIEKFGD